MNIENILGFDYYKAGFPEKGNYYFREALNLNEDSVRFSDDIVYGTALTTGDYKKAVDHLKRRYLADSTDEVIILR